MKNNVKTSNISKKLKKMIGASVYNSNIKISVHLKAGYFVVAWILFRKCDLGILNVYCKEIASLLCADL